MLLANSAGQPLELHCQAVGIIAGNVAELVSTIIDDHHLRKTLVDQTRWAGYQHDTGKAHGRFQDYLRRNLSKNDFDTGKDVDDGVAAKKGEKYKYHNQLSWEAMFHRNHDVRFGIAAHSVYHHHDSSRNVKIQKKLLDIASFPSEVLDFYDKMNCIYEKAHGPLSEIGKVGVPKGLDALDHTIDNEIFLHSLCYLIQADRWVSMMGASLNDVTLDLNGDFCPSFQQWKESRYRIKAQAIDCMYDIQKSVIDAIAADSEHNTFSVPGPPGSGKTMLGLAFCSQFDRNKSFFSAPRREICTSLMKTIGDDLGRANLKQSRELILASTQKEVVGADGQDVTPSEYKYMSSDVVIINIDSILNSMYDYSRYHCLLDLLTQPMVIDEYHEFNTGQSAILCLIRGFIAARELIKSKTLLISATPVNILLDLKVGRYDRPVIAKEIPMEYPPHLDVKREYIVTECFPELDDCSNTWIRKNTVKQTQDAFLQRKCPKQTDLVMHSLYSEQHRKEKMDKLYLNYGKLADNQTPHDVVYSTGLIECSCNVSFQNAIIECSSPESAMQSWGRVNRFGESRESKIWLVCQKLDNGQRAYINTTYDIELYYKFSDFLKLNIGKSKIMLNSEANKLIRKFNKDNKDDIDENIRRNIESSGEKTLSVKTKKSNRNRTAVDGAPHLPKNTVRCNEGNYLDFLINGVVHKVALSGYNHTRFRKLLQNNVGRLRKTIKYNNIDFRAAKITKSRIKDADVLIDKARDPKNAVLVQHTNNYTDTDEYMFFSYDNNTNILTHLGLKTHFEEVGEE